MKTVIIYGFQGRFNGKSEYAYTYPEIGAIHKCMLFVAQQDQGLNFENAIKEGLRYGFSDMENLKGNPLKVEILNTETYRGFSSFYEEAIERGSSLVYYPNSH
jgi:hypothetical protein